MEMASLRGFLFSGRLHGVISGKCCTRGRSSQHRPIFVHKSPPKKKECSASGTGFGQFSGCRDYVQQSHVCYALPDWNRHRRLSQSVFCAGCLPLCNRCKNNHQVSRKISSPDFWREVSPALCPVRIRFRDSSTVQEEIRCLAMGASCH